MMETHERRRALVRLLRDRTCAHIGACADALTRADGDAALAEGELLHFDAAVSIATRPGETLDQARSRWLSAIAADHAERVRGIYDEFERTTLNVQTSAGASS